MPPTLKDRSGLPASSESPERAAPLSAESSITQPVALEVPLTVNGEKIVEGSDTRQAFSERTTTVLVLANGAVIRLSASVAAGQVLSLTNEKTKKEITCQVVKSKNNRIASGYVEVEFTAPVLGFWGLRFPNERNSSPANTPAPRKFESAPAVSAEAKSTFTDAPPAAENFNTNLADEVDFKTEIKADSRPSNKADFLAPAQTPVDTGKLESNRLQEQLSALLKEEQKQSESRVPAVPSAKVEFVGTSAKAFDLAGETPVKVEALASKSDSTPIVSAVPKAPNTPATSSFNDEEVKIPAWLEPLARNAAIPAPPAEAAADGSDGKLQELEADKLIEPAPEPKHLPATSKISKKAAKRAPVAPTFGNSLLIESTSALNKTHGSKKGIWMAIAAVLLVAAASGAWYFRETLASLAAGRGTSSANPSPVSATSALRRSAPAAQSEAPAAPSAFKTTAPETPNSASTAKASSDANPISSLAPASSPSQGKMQTAAITERVPKSNSTADAADTTVTLAEIVEPEKKPSLGKVRLAKPKVRRPAGAQGSGEIAPSLDAPDPLSTGESALGTNFAEGADPLAGPAAPVVVGGDVIPARMISSVPPSYPALAKTQHISGDVRIDALIDPRGRVTTMKVVSGPPLLHQAAMEALKQWKYQAASLDGKPVPMHLTVTIQFRLQ